MLRSGYPRLTGAADEPGAAVAVTQALTALRQAQTRVETSRLVLFGQSTYDTAHHLAYG